MGYPDIAGLFIMENPAKIDSLGGTPISGNLHICQYTQSEIDI